MGRRQPGSKPLAHPKLELYALERAAGLDDESAYAISGLWHHDPRQEDELGERDEEQEFAREEDLAEKSLRETDDAHLDPASGDASHESEWNGHASERLDLIDLLPDRPADLTRVVCLRVARARGSSTRGEPHRSFDFTNQRWGESRPFSMR